MKFWLMVVGVLISIISMGVGIYRYLGEVLNVMSYVGIIIGIIFLFAGAYKSRKYTGATIKDAWEGTGVYSASKFGVQGLSKALADEGRAHNVRVTCICPGMVDTPQVTDGGIPRAEMIQVADVAEAAIYLATLPPNVVVQELVLERKQADS